MTSIEKEFKIKPNTYRYEIYKALSENLEELSLRDIMSRRGIHKTKAIYAISEIKKMIENGLVIRFRISEKSQSQWLDSTYIIKPY